MPHEIRVDAQKNRLYLTLQGLMSDDELRNVAEELIGTLNRMRPGFAIVNDISRFRPVTQEGMQQVKRAGAACARAGMKVTVRVVGISPTALTQFKRASREEGYTAYVAASVHEAEEILEGHVEPKE